MMESFCNHKDLSKDQLLETRWLRSAGQRVNSNKGESVYTKPGGKYC